VPSGRPLGEPAPDAQQAPVVISTETALLGFNRPAPVDATSVYLQLGAFGSKENAESYLARAKVQVEWAAQLLHLFPRDGMYRVHAGPYASSSEARLAAERIASALGTRPLVVTR
jgi:rare lipoprotein A